MKMTSIVGRSILFGLLSLCQVFLKVNGGAIFSLKLIHWQNPGGDDYNGDNCDRWPMGGCDTEFIICLDRANRRSYDNVNNCDYFKERTEEIDSDNMNFPSVISFIGTSSRRNPLLIRIDKWQGSVKLKIDVYDDDNIINGGDDLIDRHSAVLTFDAARSQASATGHRTTLTGSRPKGKTTINIETKVYCEDEYYSSECDIYCKPQDGRNGHYNCDPATGNKICLTGWKGPSCTVPSCGQNVCRSGSTCLEVSTGYTCVCEPGYTGERCDTDVDECASAPCQNAGTCSNLLNGYLCTCPHLYSGNNCQYHICDHPTMVLCHNGGTCLSNGSCICLPAYKGYKCDVFRCDEIKCQNGGSCHNGICSCKKGFTGVQCSVDICDLKLCYNNGTCVAGECQCPPRFTGDDCLTALPDCIGGMCESEKEMTTVQLTTFDLPPTTQHTQARTVKLTKKPKPVTISSTSSTTRGANDIIVAQAKHGEMDKKNIPFVASVIPIILILLCIVLIAVFLRKRRKQPSPADTSSTFDTGNIDNPLYSELGAVGFQINPSQQNMDNMDTDNAEKKSPIPENSAPGVTLSLYSEAVDYHASGPPPAYTQHCPQLPPPYEEKHTEENPYELPNTRTSANLPPGGVVNHMYMMDEPSDHPSDSHT